MKPVNRTLIFANLLALAAVLVMNWLSNSLPLNGHTPAELSDQYPNLFVPAGLTFSIWGVIYTWLLVWAGFQVAALSSGRWASKVEPIVEHAGWWFALTCVLNIAWLFAWHWEQMMLSVLIMVGLLYVLVRLNEGAGVGRSASNVLEKRAAHWPFGIYQGWITVALIANVTALLVSRGWSSSLPEATMALIMILAGALVANSMLFNRNNVPHALAVSWAFLGIYLKRNGAPEPGSDSVALLALVCCIGLAAASVWQWRRWNSY